MSYSADELLQQQADDAEPIAAASVIAAVTRQAGQAFEFSELSLEAPQEVEVLVRIVACGICHTDVAMHASTTRAPKPIVLGHEGAGVVEAVGSHVEGVRPGDHVVLTFASCGKCDACSDGHSAYCRHMNTLNFGGTRADGSTSLRSGHGRPVHSHFFGQSSFATRVIAHGSSVVKVDPDLDLAILAPLGCGVQTGAGAVLNSLGVEEGASIAIFGAGSVGLSAVMAASLAKAARIVAIDVNPARLELSLLLGATDVIDATRDEAAEALGRLIPRGVDRALDTTGRIESIQAAVGNLATAGICGLVGISTGTVPLDPRLLMLGGRSLRGIVQGDSTPQTFIPQLIEHYRAGRFPIDRLITHYEFAQINEAMHDMEAGRVIKPVLRVGSI